MIFDRISQLCIENDITPTFLCKKITGSSGNLPTWKKGNIKAEHIIEICNFFSVSSDWLLELTDIRNTSSDIQMICRETGLTEENVELLKFASMEKKLACSLKIRKKYYAIDIFNLLIENLNYFPEIFQKTCKILETKTLPNYSEEDLEENLLKLSSKLYKKIYTGGRIIYGIDYKKFLYHELIDAFNSLLRFTVSQIQPHDEQYIAIEKEYRSLDQLRGRLENDINYYESKQFCSSQAPKKEDD